jgi:hypothetical protein
MVRIEDDYRVRVRSEANEHTIETGGGSPRKQGWFEGDHEYRSRIAHEAREIRRNAATSTRSVNPVEQDWYQSGGDVGRRSGREGPSFSGASGLGLGVIAILIVISLAIWVTPKQEDVPARTPVTAEARSGISKEASTSRSLRGTVLEQMPGEYLGSFRSKTGVCAEVSHRSGTTISDLQFNVLLFQCGMRSAGITVTLQEGDEILRSIGGHPGYERVYAYYWVHESYVDQPGWHFVGERVGDKAGNTLVNGHLYFPKSR